MLDVLLAIGQFLSVMGLLYGLIVTVTRRDLDELCATAGGRDRRHARPPRASALRRRRALRRAVTLAAASRPVLGR